VLQLLLLLLLLGQSRYMLMPSMQRQLGCSVGKAYGAYCHGCQRPSGQGDRDMCSSDNKQQQQAWVHQKQQQLLLMLPLLLLLPARMTCM
jgi:hypothetical protein